MLLFSGSDFDHLPTSSDALHRHILRASCKEDSFGVRHSVNALLSPIHHIGAGRWFLVDGFEAMTTTLDIQASHLQNYKTACELPLRNEVQTAMQELCGWSDTTICASHGHCYQGWCIHLLDVHPSAIHLHFWCTLLTRVERYVCDL